MQKTISRRRSLKQATLASGAALLAGPAGAAKPSAPSHTGTPRPYHPSRAEVAEAPAPPPPPPVLLTPRALAESSQSQPVGGDETSLQFRNLTPGEVRLFWLPGDGTRKPYGTLAPGARRDMHTFSGHWWLVVGADDRPLALFVGESRAGIAGIKG